MMADPEEARIVPDGFPTMELAGVEEESGGGLRRFRSPLSGLFAYR